MSEQLEQQHGAWKRYWPKPEQLLLAIGIDASSEVQWLARQCCQLVLVAPELKQAEPDGAMAPHSIALSVQEADRKSVV